MAKHIDYSQCSTGFLKRLLENKIIIMAPRDRERVTTELTKRKDA